MVLWAMRGHAKWGPPRAARDSPSGCAKTEARGHTICFQKEDRSDQQASKDRAGHAAADRPCEEQSRLRVLGRSSLFFAQIDNWYVRRRAKGSTSASVAKHLWAATDAGLPARRRQTICCGERRAQP